MVPYPKFEFVYGTPLYADFAVFLAFKYFQIVIFFGGTLFYDLTRDSIANNFFIDFIPNIFFFYKI